MSAADTQYRPDIDGLRAVAVLSVVLYHAGVPFLPGGYVGVDIFFVISGYLITRIITREIVEDRFSLLTFYERRTRRIFPALFAMLAACVVAASLITLPGEFQDFGNSLAAATLFVSNIFFWQTADYFAGPAHLKPLLHTWSLAVEEQFYIVLPLLLLALTRWARRHLVTRSDRCDRDFVRALRLGRRCQASRRLLPPAHTLLGVDGRRAPGTRRCARDPDAESGQPRRRGGLSP